jgi:hypothetical protein
MGRACIIYKEEKRNTYKVLSREAEALGRDRHR